MAGQRGLSVALERESAFATCILDTVREPLLILDAGLRVVRANRSFYRTFQVQPEETEGRLLYHLGNGQWDIPRLRELLEQMIPQLSQVDDFEVVHDLPRVGLRSMLLNARRIEEPGRDATTLLLAIEDITERKQAQQQLAHHARELERSNAELERFAYVASHDLQEPLRVVASYVQLLARRYRGRLDSDADEFIAFAVDASRRMQILINNLLAYSRLTTRGGEFLPTDGEALLSGVLDNLRAALQETGAVVEHDPLPTIVADASQLAQVFQNLISNALKFHGEEPPHLRISASPQGSDWLFSVQDNGIGFDPRYAETIFILFKRLHGPREYAGTGVGLAICKRVIERHGGRIWVESEPGRGATFFFTLPAGYPTAGEEDS